MMGHYIDPQVTNPKDFIDIQEPEDKTVDPLSYQVQGNHYTQGSIQPLEYIMANNMNFIQGNVVKYITRYRFKGTPKQDLEKVKHYVDLLIDHHEKEGWE